MKCLQKQYIWYNLCLKYATGGSVIIMKSDPDNITYEYLRKVIATFRHCRDKAMQEKTNYLLIRYCQCVHVEKMERRVIYVEEHNINAINLTDFCDITISDHTAYVLIATAVNAGN